MVIETLHLVKMPISQTLVKHTGFSTGRVVCRASAGHGKILQTAVPCGLKVFIAPEFAVFFCSHEMMAGAHDMRISMPLSVSAQGKRPMSDDCGIAEFYICYSFAGLRLSERN